MIEHNNCRINLNCRIPENGVYFLNQLYLIIVNCHTRNNTRADFWKIWDDALVCDLGTWGLTATL